MGVLSEPIRGVAAALEADKEYQILSKWFTCAMGMVSENDKYTVQFYRGKVQEVFTGAPVTGTDFILSSPEEEWRKLLKGEIKLFQGLNPNFGKFSLQGNLILAANHMRSICEVIRKLQVLST